MTPFSKPDLDQLAEIGIAAAEAERQLALLSHPPAPVVLDRPCTVGDGIARIGAAEGGDLLKLHAEVADRGRVSVFVPASGAATRMFKDLMTARADASLSTPAALDDAARSGRQEARGTREFFAGLDRFAFFAKLKAAAERSGMPMRTLVREGPIEPILTALLEDSGLGYATLPKGLLEFHDYPDGPRTPFDEHLFEASQFAADGEYRCRLHFTVSPEHRALFESRLAVAPRIEPLIGASFEVGFSVQRPATDTLAATPEGEPFRTGDGRLLLRPAGHGALIENLAGLGADLVLIKNIDNVAHDRFKRDTFTWSRLLLGLAARLERTAVSLWRRLEGGGDEQAVADATQFLAATFRRESSLAANAPRPERGAWARTQLARPIRVCGMVPNTGEPGGGPMWVRGTDGVVTPQIVELSQVNESDAGQRAVVAASTHFNPVFMALALRDGSDRPPLADFVDERAVIIVNRSAEGRDLLALERPGLWNGAMAGWNTVFVEVPLTVFNPVKTVNDLLRKEHQPG